MEDHLRSHEADKAKDAPEAAPRFKAGDTARRRSSSRQQVVIRKSIPPSSEAYRAHAEGAPPPPFEYECYWFEDAEYKTAIVFEFEREEETNH